MERVSLLIMKRIFFFISIAFLSCGIESFENMDAPNTPMGLQAVSSNKFIYLTFTAYNPLDTFSGYVIFTGSSPTAIRNPTTADPRRAFTNDSWIAYPYLKMSSFDTVSNIQITLEGYDPVESFSISNWIYIGVAAYDSVNSRLSGISDIVNVEVVE